MEEDSNENIFELQHHHLLRCLEKTTVKMIMFIPGNACNKTVQNHYIIIQDYIIVQDHYIRVFIPGNACNKTVQNHIFDYKNCHNHQQPIVFIPGNVFNKNVQDREFVDMDLPFNGILTCMELYLFIGFDLPFNGILRDASLDFVLD